MDGFYAAFLTGRGGNTIVLFAIKSTVLVGVDAGGVKYDGSVQPLSDGGYRFLLSYVVQPGTQLITGMGSVGTPTPVQLDFIAPNDFASGVVITIQTPLGPVNAKLSKLRDLDLPSQLSQIADG
jgi:hypothetical protein